MSGLAEARAGNRAETSAQPSHNERPAASLKIAAKGQQRRPIKNGRPKAAPREHDDRLDLRGQRTAAEDDLLGGRRQTESD
jgi:hypothetical protein